MFVVADEVALTITTSAQTITVIQPILIGGAFDFTYRAAGNVVRFTIGPVLPVGASGFRLDFGDGTFATFDKPSSEIVHTYAKPGSYEVKLIAGDVPRVAHTVDVVFGRSRGVRH